MGQGLEIVECGRNEMAQWNRFVAATAGSTYCHLFQWKDVIEAAYRLETRYLAVTEGGRWLGVFPAVVMPALPWKGKKAVSVAFCNYGDVLVEEGESPEHILQICLNHLASIGIERVEVRRLVAEPGEAEEVTLIRRLPESPDALWREIGDKVRNQIRKAQKNGLTVHWGRDQAGAFYNVYKVNIGRLGTPVHSLKFFEEAVRRMEDAADVLTVRYQGAVIAGMLVVASGKTWADPMASSLPAYKALNPNMLMYWEALRAACEKGAEFFDFGRSRRDSGTYRFKRQWGAQPYPLDYRTFKNGVPEGPSSTSYYRSQPAKLASLIWRRLPGGLQGFLGPSVRKWMP